uniref:Uncharacterized protein n=1 Tax=Magallana gigas TaxID=29159 RepID=A0A8W8P2K8_MAGGI
MTDEETAPRSKHGYVNLSEDKNSTVPPAPKPSGISMILKPILSLKGVQFQENVEQATSASNVVSRYSKKGKELGKIQVDDIGKDLYGRPIYITENSNRDIIVSDEQRKAIVVVDECGRHRFNYKSWFVIILIITLLYISLMRTDTF